MHLLASQPDVAASTDEPEVIAFCTGPARALWTDEDEGAFKAKLALIARHKPKAEVSEPNGKE